MIYTDKEFQKKFKVGYYDEKKHVSNSMIGDYLKDPFFYHCKHIEGSICQKAPSPAMKVGSAVDMWITEGKSHFDTYIIKKKKYLKKEEKEAIKVLEADDDFIVLTEGEYSQAVLLATRLLQQSLLQTLLKDKNTLRQPILTGKINKVKVKGKFDLLTVDGDTVIITDIKTAQTIKPAKYFFHCHNYGYYRQMAMYRELAEQNYPDKKIECYHLTVEKDSDGIHNCAVFGFTDHMLENGLLEINETLKKIATQDEWRPQEVILGDVIVLGDVVGSKDVSFTEL